MEIEVVLEPQEEGGFTVFVPSLKGCISQGETKEEALSNIKEAIELFLETGENEIIIYKNKGNIEISNVSI
ncbi:HicB family protein [Candidatus Pacearchaeota archaeon CG10_big_fil_rev_8_21_14_0_10_32_14]|nr:MAG: HicB family protein [Candidatus Pacearchaeota archaeon CG10_big_fil_rev_8_21_14_0_10_32_14]